MTGANVLVIVGSRAKSANDALAVLVAESASNGITVNVFDALGELPPYSETLEAERPPDSVVALRAAATEADAALVVTNYHGRVSYDGAQRDRLADDAVESERAA